MADQSDRDAKELAKELVSLRREVERLKRSQRAPQLTRSSIDDGAVEIRKEGVTVGLFGLQADGTVAAKTVGGPVPPAPSTPEVSALGPAVLVRWDGAFAGGVAEPGDFQLVEVHASATPLFTADETTRRGAIFKAGGEWALDTATDIYVALVTRATSGQVSVKSAEVLGQPGPVVIPDGTVTTLQLADDAVTQAKIAAGAVGTAEIAGNAVDLSKLADGSVDATKIIDGSVSSTELSTAVNNDISQASSDAAAAIVAADEAIATADDAHTVADSKITTFYQATAPVAGTVGDLWIDTDDDSLARWDGTSWVAVQDADIAQALADAATAQTTADGKIVSFFQPTAPVAEGVGDIWYDTDDGNSAHWWDGLAWQPVLAGTNAIADDAIVTSKVAANAIGANQIAANAIIAGKIAAAAVEAGNLAAGSVQAGNIAAGAVQAGNIAANSVTAAEIAALSITSDELAANSVIAGKVAAGAITAGNLAADSVEAGNIAAGAVTAEKLESQMVLTNTLIAGDPAAGRVEVGVGSDGGGLGIEAIAPDGLTRTFNLDALTGEVFQKGRSQFGTASQLESDYIDLFEQPVGIETPNLRQSTVVGGNGTFDHIDLAWPSPTQPGNLLLACVFVDYPAGGFTPNITPPSGWLLVGTSFSGAGRRLSLYYIPDALQRSGTETFNLDRTCYRTLALYEYSGAEVLDKVATADGVSSTVASGTTSTTTQAQELWFAVGGASDSVPVHFDPPSNGFTNLGGATSTTGGGVEVRVSSRSAHRIATATGAASTSWTIDNSSAWFGVIATFKAKTSGGDAPAPAEAGKVRLYTKDRNGEPELHSINSNGIIRVLGNDAVFLAEQEITSTTTAVTFSSIDQNYRNLVLSMRANRVNDANAYRLVWVRFNGDTGSNYKYSWKIFRGGATNTFFNGDAEAGTTLETGVSIGTSTSNGEITIYGYSRPGTVVVQGQGWSRSGSTAEDKGFTVGGGRWNVTGPVTSVTIGLQAGDFGSGSGIQLWGVGKLV